MLHHIHRLRNKPEHVRKNVAFLGAGAVTLVVAVGWGVATIASGTLNLKPTSLASSDAAPVVEAVSQTSSGISQLLGAVGAAGATSSQPALQIVDTGRTSTLDQPVVATTSVGQQTVIPF